MKTDKDQLIRWILPKPINENQLVNLNLNRTLQKVLIRRGIDLNDGLDEYLTPSELPNSETHFKELSKASNRIIEACENNEKIAICGDYDADGITSTVLLLEILSLLGGRVKSFIPSRKDEGYGLNIKMINEINNQKIGLIITVDNGISAFKAIEKSNEFGIDLIITDHHKIPESELKVHSLIHPERTPSNSPYKYLAGVGIAYVLAKNICSKLKYDINNTSANTLFCIGTIADMAPLIGANRKWIKEYLPKINLTTNIGIRAIIKKLSLDKKEITTEDIGYKIAPLINSVGRIGDPKLVIKLFTDESKASVDKLVTECFALSSDRKRITSLIQHEAMQIALDEYQSDNKFLVMTKKDWHLGVIGIIAARIVEEFNLPTAILAQAKDGNFRGSIRSNKILKVNHALDECSDLLIAHGGHSAAAGFSIKGENISKFKDRLNIIAKREFKDVDLSKSIKPDAYIRFEDINFDFCNQLEGIGPFGIMNPLPIFWTRKCRITNINVLKGGHLRINLNDGSSSIQAVKWNNTKNLKIHDEVDIAFYIEINTWKNKKTIQLNILDIKKHQNIIDLKIHKQIYKCQLTDDKKILITNAKGQSIDSYQSQFPDNLDTKKYVFVNKIMKFAEIALGKAA